MSKIQAVNYQQQPKLAQPHANHASAQSFGHGLSDLPKPVQDILTKGVGSRISTRLGKIGKVYTWLSDTQGEIQTQAINNLFTASLAPAMIAFNPFTKQDEKTKKYTAWRQPISAVIAMTAGLAMTLGINKFMENTYHQGYLETIDLRMIPDKNYLKKTYYKTEEKRGFFSRSWRLLKGEENPRRDKFIKDVQEERLNFFTRLMTEAPENIKFDEKTKAILVNGEDLQAGQKIRVPGFETKKALDKFIQANSFHNKTFGQFLKERFGFEFFPDGELKPNITDAKLSDIKAMDFLKEMGLIDEKVSETELRKGLGVMQQSRKIEEVREIFKRIKMNQDDASHLLEVIGKNTTRVTQLYMGEQLGKAKATTMGQLLHQLGIDLASEGGNKSVLQKATESSMVKAVNGLKKNLDDLNINGFKENADASYFIKNILKNSTKRMAEHAKNYQKYAGIGFNLITTGVSCYILNWAYPRIMDRFFPELTVSKQKPDAVKGGNK